MSKLFKPRRGVLFVEKYFRERPKCRRREIKSYSNFDSHESFLNTKHEKRPTKNDSSSSPVGGVLFVERIFGNDQKCRRHEIKSYSNFDSHESFLNTKNEKRYFFQPRRGLIFVERIFEKDQSAIGTKLKSIQFLILMSLFY